MIFRQLFDNVSFTYTYLLASRPGGEAVIIDPVLERVERYVQLLTELDLKLVKAVDTHCHADHITALGELRDRTQCITVMGRETSVDVVSMRVEDGDTIDIEGLSLGVLHTPGHTDDSYCFTLPDRIFTGDTLLIRGTGRTDFQNGSSEDAYRSLFGKVLTLPGDTLVYPGHDYKGDMVSTIAEEKAFNPRLQVGSAEEYADIMAGLDLDNPKMMDVAIPANLTIGFHPTDPDIVGRTLGAREAMKRLDAADTLFIDLREEKERVKDGVIPGSLHAPYTGLADHLSAGGLLGAMASETGRELLLYCAYGERSALALRAVLDAGFDNACHIGGGVAAWVRSGGPLEPPA